MDLGKVSWKPSVKDSRCDWEHSWFMGKGQNININKRLEEVDPNSHEWLRGVQDFSGGSNCTCDKSNRRTRIKCGAWRCGWIAVKLW